jgi:hypothetical protein
MHRPVSATSGGDKLFHCRHPVNTIICLGTLLRGYLLRTFDLIIFHLFSRHLPGLCTRFIALPLRFHKTSPATNPKAPATAPAVTLPIPAVEVVEATVAEELVAVGVLEVEVDSPELPLVVVCVEAELVDSGLEVADDSSVEVDVPESSAEVVPPLGAVD